MTQDRAYDITVQLLTRLKDVFSATQIYQRNLDAHLEEAKRLVFDCDLFKRLPNYRKYYLRGAEKILWDNLYAGKNAPLIWVLIGTDGKQFGPGNDEWLKESSEYKSAMNGVHAWRTAWEKNGELKSW